MPTLLAVVLVTVAASAEVVLVTVAASAVVVHTDDQWIAVAAMVMTCAAKAIGAATCASTAPQGAWHTNRVHKS